MKRLSLPFVVATAGGFALCGWLAFADNPTMGPYSAPVATVPAPAAQTMDAAKRAATAKSEAAKPAEPVTAENICRASEKVREAQLAICKLSAVASSTDKKCRALTTCVPITSPKPTEGNPTGSNPRPTLSHAQERERGEQPTAVATAPAQPLPSIGAYAEEGANYPDEGARALAAQTFTDKRDVAAGVAKAQTEAQTKVAAYPDAYPDEDTRGRGAVGYAAEYRAGYLAAEDDVASLAKANLSKGYLAGLKGQSGLDNLAPEKLVKVVNAPAVADGEGVKNTAFLTATTNASANIDAAQLTTGPTATELITQGRVPVGKKQGPIFYAQYCKERNMSAETCAAFVTTMDRESAFKPYADNPTSTAYGLGQYLNSRQVPTWLIECKRYLKASAAQCNGPLRGNVKAQADVLLASINDRYQQYKSGSLECKSLSFQTCNYAVYHYAGSWKAPNDVRVGINYFNSKESRASYTRYANAMANLGDTTALAQLSLTNFGQGAYTAEVNAQVGNTKLVANATYNQGKVNYNYQTPLGNGGGKVNVASLFGGGGQGSSQGSQGGNQGGGFAGGGSGGGNFAGGTSNSPNNTNPLPVIYIDDLGTVSNAPAESFGCAGQVMNVQIIGSGLLRNACVESGLPVLNGEAV